MTSGEVQKEAIEKARAELGEAMEKGEFDKGFFNDDEWEQLTNFIKTGEMTAPKTSWSGFCKNNPSFRMKVSRVFHRIFHHE